ncbi:MAG: PKD domain-containing protein [Rubrivivax sp.]
MTKLSRLIKALATGLCAALLVACGGGSGGGQPVAPEPPANRSPVASAGAAQTVSAGTAVPLDGSASSDPDGDALSYTWNLAGPAGSAASLLANGGGRVAYAESGKTYTWASSTGQSTLRLDTAPGQTFMAGGAMVFTIGPTVYRVGLD